MSFLLPMMATAAALSVSIPILIHLLIRRRRQPVDWAAMDLLMEALRRVSRRRRIERLLLLAARCALLLVGGLALAEPLLGSVDGGAWGVPRRVLLLLDDSAATMEEGADGSAFEAMRARATEVVDSLGSGDSVGVVLLSDQGRSVLPPTTDTRAVQAMLESLSPSAGPADLEGSIRKLGAMGAAEWGASWILLSQWRAGSVPVERPLPEIAGGGPQEVEATEPWEGSPSNVAIESVRLRRTGPGDDPSSALVEVSLIRRGASREALTVPIEVRDAQGASAGGEARFEEGSVGASAVITLARHAEAGERDWAIIARIPADAQPADNWRATVAGTLGKRVVGIVDRPSSEGDGLESRAASSWMAHALSTGDEGSIEVERIDPASLGAMRGLDAVILLRPDLIQDEGWKALDGFLRRGGALLVAPPATDARPGWQERVAALAGEGWSIGEESQSGSWQLDENQPRHGLTTLLWPELGDLASPVAVDRIMRADPGPRSEDVVLRARGGEPILLARTAASGAGIVAYLAASPTLQWTNLPAKPLMVPLMQEFVRQGGSMARVAPTLLAGPATVSIPGVRSLKLIRAGVGEPRETIAVDESIPLVLRGTGVYEALDRNGSPLAKVAVNVDLSASDISPVDPARLRQWLDPVVRGTGSRGSAASGGARTQGRDLASAFLVGAIALAGIETLLARRFARPEVA